MWNTLATSHWELMAKGQDKYTLAFYNSHK